MKTVVSNLMVREIILDIINEETMIRTPDELADFLLKHRDNETIFVEGWESNVDWEPFDDSEWDE
ncbi:hypothetical protein P9173_09540 [Bacillus safensis]|uniref:hypothetical protein n=1 Tax=Bacillus safensis TaxID=561879 RepID=UPI002281B70F|nr:hypothetical protein [Bacillus safensis]MCY7542456.1 hypothetical protein [Bacillus safensis]MCY7552575.1 hypothetical protein [Bacillus safensis]MCY7644762.1 hypothetical protein [Bacillus safensis]MCY7655923.1 hypothetical protein [Bacillus safensis]MEC3710398.1 hypothetical protein [Bacillus safensis]